MSTNINDKSYYVLTFIDRYNKEVTYKIYSTKETVENADELMNTFMNAGIQNQVYLTSKKSITWYKPKVINVPLDI